MYGAEIQRKCLAAVAAIVSQQRPVTEYSLRRNLFFMHAHKVSMTSGYIVLLSIIIFNTLHLRG